MAYRNNVMLADLALARIRKALEETGQWQDIWMVVSSDHSWRETPTIDGIRDLRVPFILKSAGTNQPVTYERRFNTVVTHDFVLAVLRAEITNQSAAIAWLDQHAKDLPTLKPGNSHH